MLEAIVAVLVDAAALACSLALLVATASISSACRASRLDLATTRQIEHLVDDAVAGMISFRGVRGSVVSGPRRFLVAADIDADGRIDRNSREISGFELSTDAAGTVRLLHRIGRQRMTVEKELPHTSVFAYIGGTRDAPALAVIPLPMTPLSVALRGGQR